MKQVRKWMQLITVIAAVIVMGLNAQAAVKLNKTNVVLIKGQKIILKVKGTSKKSKMEQFETCCRSGQQQGNRKGESKGLCRDQGKGREKDLQVQGEGGDSEAEQDLRGLYGRIQI